MKYLLVIVVVGVVLWLMIGRRRHLDDAAGGKQAPPVPMLACTHCGVHLPRTDAVFDSGGRPFCTPAHRLAGPR